MYPHQSERLTAVLEREGLHALVATAPENIAYVTGFRSLSQVVYRRTPVFAVFTRRATALVVPLIDAPAVAAAGVDVDHVASYGEFYLDYAEAPGDEARRVREWTAAPAATAADGLAAALAALGVASGSVGLDDGHLPHDGWRRVSERLAPVTVAAAATHFAEARAVKSPYEIECLHRALGIAEEGVNAVIQMLKPGVTEQAAVTLFEEEIVRRGATLCATIIAMGARSALPAAYPSDKALRRGDLVRFDLGCVWRGYFADVARTAVMGKPTERQENRYVAIQTGLEATLDAMKPGVSVGRLFDRAVEATRAAGLVDYRRHHIGHGIGLEPFEPPVLTADEDTELEPGMVLRVETPVYELGEGGMNVKETVLVTRLGARVLNRSARGLVVLD